MEDTREDLPQAPEEELPPLPVLNPEGSERGSLVSAPDLSSAGFVRHATITVGGKSETITFDLEEMTPALRRRVEAMDTLSETEKEDAMILFVATLVTDWTLTDKFGAPVPISVEGVQSLSYKKLTAVAKAIQEANSPNDDGRAD